MKPTPPSLQRAAVLLLAGLSCQGAEAQLGKRQKEAPRHLELKNETSEPVRVDLLDPKGQSAELACLGPGGNMRWASVPRNTAQIRMQAFRGECMKPQVGCQFAIPYASGLTFAVLRGEGRKCGIFPMPEPAPPMLKGAAAANQMCGPTNAWAPLTFRNAFPNRAMWVTIENINRSSNRPNPRRAACFGPNEVRMHCIDPTTINLRAEVQDTPYCARSSAVICDTNVETQLAPQPQQPPAGAFVELRPNGNGCQWTRIEYGRPPS